MLELRFFLKNKNDEISENSPDPDIRELASFLKKRSLSPFARSIRVRMVDAGSSNDVEIEEGLANSPQVDLERFGIHFVASPRHADVLIATGPVTKNMKLALEKTFAAMPSPKAVIAAGDGACTGFPFARGGPAIAGSGAVKDTITVDLEVPGNPPTPYQLVLGILKAGAVLEKKAKAVK